MKQVLFAAFFGISFCGLNFAEANLVTNGDFESGNVGFSSQYSGYSVGSNPAVAPGAFSDWAAFGDHTSGHGLMLITGNATTANLNVWYETIPVTPGTNYQFSFWAATVNNDTPSSNYLPAMQGDINSQNVGSAVTLPIQAGVWSQSSTIWNSGSYTTAVVGIFDQDIQGAYGDFAVDDISFTPVPEPLTAGFAVVGGATLMLSRRRKRSAVN